MADLPHRPVMRTALARDAVWYGAATLAERGASLLLLPLLTKTLSQELFGVWSQIVTSAALATGVMLLGLQTGAVQFLSGGDEMAEKNSVVHGMFLVAAVNGAVAIAVTLSLARPLSTVTFGSTTFVGYARLLGIYWAVEALSELAAAVLRAHRDIRAVSLYYFVKNVLRLGILGIALIVVGLDLLQGVLAVVTVQFVVTGLMYVTKVRPRAGARPNLTRVRSRWREILRFSMPLVPYGLLVWMNTFLGRYIVLHMIGLGAVGVYSVAYSLASVGGLFYAVLGFVLYPYLVERLRAGDVTAAGGAIRGASQLFLFAQIPVSILLTMLNAPITRLLSTQAYVAGWELLLMLCLGITFTGLYQLNLYATLLGGRMRENFGILFIAAAVNIVANGLLIPVLGILGAGVATAASSGILGVLTVFIGRQVIPHTLSRRAVIQMAAGGTAMGAFVFAARHLFSVDSVWALSTIAAVGVLVYAAIGFRPRMLLSVEW